MRPPTCSTCTPSRKSSTPCWRARVAPRWRRPASISCPTAPGSIWRAGRPRTSLPIREAFRAFPGAELPRGGHIPGTFSPGALGASACPGESLPPDLIRGWAPVRRQGHAPTNESRACPDSAGTGHALEHEQRGPHGHDQEHERSCHEDGETEHDDVDDRLHEAVEDPQRDIEPGERKIE